MTSPYFSGPKRPRTPVEYSYANYPHAIAYSTYAPFPPLSTDQPTGVAVYVPETDLSVAPARQNIFNPLYKRRKVSTHSTPSDRLENSSAWVGYHPDGQSYLHVSCPHHPDNSMVSFSGILQHCTLCSRESEGYQALDNTCGPESSYGLDVPYVSEKQPDIASLPQDGYVTPYYDDPSQGFASPARTLQPSMIATNIPEQFQRRTSQTIESGVLVPVFQDGPVVKDRHVFGSRGALLPVTASSHPSYDENFTTIFDNAGNLRGMAMTSTPLPVLSSPAVPMYTVMETRPPYALSTANGFEVPHKQSSTEISLPAPKCGKRGPFRDQARREQTAHTRRLGSCIRCRMQRIRCEQNTDDPDGDCLKCARLVSSRIGQFPCLRYKITDISLYKPGPVPGYEWTKRWQGNIAETIHTWASPEIKTILVSDGISAKPVELRVRRFVPQEGDKLERTWFHNGLKKSVKIPPYALIDIEDTKRAYNKHIRESVDESMLGLLGPKDGLLHKTYSVAHKMLQDSRTSKEVHELLFRTLKLWMSVRLTTRSSFIVGKEKLGMADDILDETSPTPGKIPMPPVLGAQLDIILIHHIQARLRRDLLDLLQKMVLKKSTRTWIATYLVSFILLHNASLITAHDASYASKHGMSRRFAREDKVQEYYSGANVLLAHFHYCNGGLNAGPFGDGSKQPQLQELGALDEDAVQLIHTTRQHIKMHGHEWTAIRERGAYEDEFYFVGQLFDREWTPGHMC